LSQQLDVGEGKRVKKVTYDTQGAMETPLFICSAGNPKSPIRNPK